MRLKDAKRPWCSQHQSDIFDEWDVRERPEIEFESVVLHKDEKPVFAANFSDAELHSKAIHAYRQNVVNLMEKYFNAANLTTSQCRK